MTPTYARWWRLAGVPVRFLSFLLRYRYLAFAVLFNLPGNALIGGFP